MVNKIYSLYVRDIIDKMYKQLKELEKQIK